MNAVAVRVVVDVLQLVQDVLAIVAILFVIWTQQSTSIEIGFLTKKKKRTLVTEINGDKFHFADELDELVVIFKLFDDVRVGILLNEEPVEDALLVLQVTGVDDRIEFAVPEENHSRKSEDAHLAREFLVVDLDEVNTAAFGLVVDVLQFGQHRVALLTVHVAVCQSETNKSNQTIELVFRMTADATTYRKWRPNSRSV